jgi:hypothetical protein
MDNDFVYDGMGTALLEKVRLSLAGKISNKVLSSVYASVAMSDVFNALVVEFSSILTGEREAGGMKVYPIPWQDWGVSGSQFNVLKQHCDPRYEEERDRLKKEVETLSKRVESLEKTLGDCKKIIHDYGVENRFMCFDN